MTSVSTRREMLMASALVLSTGVVVHPASAQEFCEDGITTESTRRLNQSEAQQPEIERLYDEIADYRRRIYEAQKETYPARFPAETIRRARDVGRTVRESVVVLDVESTQSEGTATAWFVTEHDLMTNAHNVQGDDNTLSGFTVDGRQFGAELVGRVADHQPDVAVLRTDVTGTPLPMGNSEGLSNADPLVQVGHPGGFGFWVITLGGYLDHRSPTELSTTIPGLEGNSGSPIINLDGDVVAMTFGAVGEIEPTIEPTDDTVRVGLLAGEPGTAAVPIEAAMEHMERWT